MFEATDAVITNMLGTVFVKWLEAEPVQYLLGLLFLGYLIDLLCKIFDHKIGR